MFAPDLESRAKAFIGKASEKRVKVATAESCTGGLVAALLTEISGSSAVVDRGFVTYSNEAKQQMLGVPTELLGLFGAVSEPVAKAMAEGAVVHSAASIAVAITGVAGPGGGSVEKPVGMVCFAIASPNGTRTFDMRFGDLGRRGVRLASVSFALSLLEQAIG